MPARLGSSNQNIMPNYTLRVRQVTGSILILLLPSFILYSAISIPGFSDLVYGFVVSFFNQTHEYVDSFFGIFSLIVPLFTN